MLYVISFKFILCIYFNIFHACRTLTGQLGEPGHTPALMSEGEVVGWGKTLTDKDKLIDIVSTALQQKLSMELMSNKECGDRYYEDMGIDLRGEIR